MNCDQKNREETIARYLTGELSENEAQAFEEHYFQCNNCFRELKATEEAVNLIEQEGNDVLYSQSYADKSIKKKSNQGIFDVIFSKQFGIATSLVVVLIILFLTLPIDKNSQRKHQSIASNNADSLNNRGVIKNIDSTSKNSEKPSANEIAAEFSGKEFKANPYMEAWMFENVRSESDKFDKMISPEVGQKFYGKEILFRWKMIKDEPVTFTIITNQEKRIFRTDPSTKNYPAISTKVLPSIFKHSGLYYFRIEDADEVLHVGKFYFIKK